MFGISATIPEWMPVVGREVALFRGNEYWKDPLDRTIEMSKGKVIKVNAELTEDGKYIKVVGMTDKNEIIRQKFLA